MRSLSKAWILLAIISIGVISIGHFALGREGLLIGLFLMLAMNTFIFVYEDQRVLSLLKGQLVEGRDPWRLLERIRRIATVLRTPCPQLIVIPDAAPQALVVGRSFNRGVIVVTEGLLQRFSEDEVDSLLSYLIANIRLVNTLAYAVGSFLSGLIIGIAEVMDSVLRMITVEKKDPNYFLSQFFSRMVAPFAGLILRLAVPSSLYYAADAAALSAISDPKVFARALWKMESFATTKPFDAPVSIGHLFIVNPLTVYRWNRYFRVQPPVRERIRRLIGYYPI